MSFVILGMDADMKAQVFGTKTGLPFKVETSADRYAKRLAEQYPHIQTLVLPVSELPPLVNPLSTRALSRADG